MTVRQRLEKLLTIFNYREACKFLQDEYGMPEHDYYHIGKSGSLTVYNKSRGSEGLQCHHICEDLAASLSDKLIAEATYAEHPEYQAKENLCYCNLLEHMYLHLLISEQQQEQEDGSYLGDGGVRWMVLALNSIYANPDASWFSKKGAYEKLTVAERAEIDAIKGLNYNVSNILTDNYDLYLRIVNRYCTSAYIRLKLDMEPKDIALSLCFACREDKGVKSIYHDIRIAGTYTYLFGWNIDAYATMEDCLKSDRTALIKICTGGGKTTTGLEYLRVHDCKALALGSGNTIKDSWLKTDDEGNVYEFNKQHIDYKNYQTFMNVYKMINWSKYQVIICDEAHHMQADRWGEGIDWVLQNVPHVKVIGLTATPNPEQLAGTDAEFQGRICYGLDLAEGMRNGQIYMFDYIQSIYEMDAVKGDFEKHGIKGKMLWEQLNIEASKEPVQKILADNMPKGVRKIIVFVQKIKEKDKILNLLKQYNPLFASEDYMRFISSQDPKYAAKAKEWFNTTNDHDVCLVSRDMINEGLHPEGVNTLIMFRSTRSNRLYMQQLGRIVVTTEGHKDPNGIVFDFTNNAQMLIYRNKNSLDVWMKDADEDPSDVPEESEENQKHTLDDEISSIIETIKESGAKIVKDYTENCIAVLNSLNDIQRKNLTTNVIYKAFVAELSNINLPEELLDMDAWKDLKVTSAEHSIVITKGHGCASRKHSSSKNKKDKKPITIERTTVKASDVEKVAVAFTILLKRAFNFGCLDFSDDSRLTPSITNEAKFKEVCQNLGFKKSESVFGIVKRLEQRACLIAEEI